MSLNQLCWKQGMTVSPQNALWISAIIFHIYLHTTCFFYTWCSQCLQTMLLVSLPWKGCWDFQWFDIGGRDPETQRWNCPFIFKTSMFITIFPNFWATVTKGVKQFAPLTNNEWYFTNEEMHFSPIKTKINWSYPLNKQSDYTIT